MPKSNFNQFLDECENFRVAKNTSMSKISFVTKPDSSNEFNNKTNETNNETKNETSQNCTHTHDHIKILNTFSSNSTSNTRCGSGSGSGSSSNIFLSKSANNSQTRFDRFSTNGMNDYTAATAATNATINVQTNIFKKMNDNNQCFNQIPTITSTSMPMSPTTVVEINNETFPSLKSAAITITTTNNSIIPKKFKNFKDAICASAAASTPVQQSPAKQKQARALPNTAIPLPMVVKRDSEMYAKKMLAKTKKNAAFYDDGDDDGDDDDDNRNSKPIFMNNYGNDSDGD